VTNDRGGEEMNLKESLLFTLAIAALIVYLISLKVGFMNFDLHKDNHRLWGAHLGVKK
jgi:hypothetical protein